MLAVMSVNRKFFEYTPMELFNIVSDYNIDGFEIYIDYKNPNELKYLEDLANICHINNKHFQVHGDSSLSLEEQISFMKKLESIYNLFNYKINVVLHPLSLETKEESIKKTINYLTELSNNIDNTKITISLENLNKDGKIDRLGKTDIIPIVANDENVFMTFDIGHEIYEYGNITNINEYIIPLITNVHIHSMNNIYHEGFDHKPIYKNDEHWNEIIKSILFLKKNKYIGPVVFEYDLYTCKGDTLKEKIASYAQSIEFISERFK